MKLGITWTKYLGLDGNDAKLYERSETSGVLAHLMAKMDANLILEVAVMPALHLLLSVNGLIKISLNASMLGIFLCFQVNKISPYLNQIFTGVEYWSTKKNAKNKKQIIDEKPHLFQILLDVEDQRKIVQTLIIGDLLDAIIKKTKSVEKEYNGNDIKRLLKESANVISILDSHFPSIRLLDPVIICLFETFDAMHVLRLLILYVSFECKTNLFLVINAWEDILESVIEKQFKTTQRRFILFLNSQRRMDTCTAM